MSQSLFCSDGESSGDSNATPRYFGFDPVRWRSWLFAQKTKQ
jgi:hypothetical protein